ncbi:MAG: enoyl-CoA hydratase/isomerase family protein, partial [Dehalococcoidia bacterium]|nr:enoyl-CoA hydratase/isomerase family protein [Dehalococcoidia bacterium]
MVNERYGDVGVTVDGHVVVAEVQRGPNNHFDVDLIDSLSQLYEDVDKDPHLRAIVLCAEGKHFCAGANLVGRSDGDRETEADGRSPLYTRATRMIAAKTPVVAAVQGAAVGGGLGLACSADFRVGCSETRMTANFAQLGFHHGFGLTVLLPPIVGQQRAWELLYTGKRIDGEEAFKLGLLDRFVTLEDVRTEAIAFAKEIASSAPLALASIRETMRGDLAERYRAATDRENEEQARLRQTEDYKEGVKAYSERR